MTRTRSVDVLSGSREAIRRNGFLVVPEAIQEPTLTALALPLDGVGEGESVRRRGGVLLMKPLLLHSSSTSQTPRHRRVVHLEFAAQP